MRADDIRILYDYDSWAMGRILDTAEGLTEEQFTAPSPLGGDSLRETLIHILDAYGGWREGLIAGGRVPGPDTSGIKTFQGVRRHWQEQERETHEYLAGLSDEDLAQPFRPIGLPLWQPLVHVANHGTQHRSEAAMLLTYHGRSPGDLDFVFYLRDVAQNAARK